MDDFEAYYRRLHNLTNGLPATLYVLAAEEVAFRDVLLKHEVEDA